MAFDRVEYMRNYRKRPEVKARNREHVEAWRSSPKGRSHLRWYRNKYQPLWAQALRLRLMELLGSRCVRCGFSDVRALQFDHINGDGWKERKRGLRVAETTKYKRWIRAAEAGAVPGTPQLPIKLLCSNCNQIKRHEKKEFGIRKKNIDGIVS